MSEAPARTHWIVRALVFLLRLLVFALTGEWVQIGRDASSSDEELPSAPRAAVPQRTFAKSLSVQDAVSAAERVLARAQQTKALARARTAGDAWPTFVENAIEAPIQRQLSRGREGDVRALLALPALIEASDATLSVLSSSLEERANSSYGALLADAEAFAAALAGPLYVLARGGEIPLRDRRFVGLSPAQYQRVAAHAGPSLVAPLPVSPTLREEPRFWALLAREVSATLLRDAPAIVAEIREHHAYLAPQLFLPPNAGGYDPDAVLAALGVWMDELVADVMATYLLGPSYVEVLSELTASPKEPARVITAQALGRWLSPEPPSRLRLHASLLALEGLGFHVEAKKLRERFDRVHGAPDKLRLPTSGEEVAEVPYDFVGAELDEILSFSLTEPMAALSGRSWLSLPGFAFLHGEQAQAAALRPRLVQGVPHEGPERVLVAGAILAVLDNPKARERVANALRGSIRGAETLEAVAGVPSDATSGPRAPVSGLRAVLRSPRAVREAVILGEALARPGHSARR